jgi:hypothetical protein
MQSEMDTHLWRRWTLANGLGFVMAFVLGNALGSTGEDLRWNAPVTWSIAELISYGLRLLTMGAVGGYVQWFVLQRHISEAVWWVLTSALGFALGWSVGISAGSAIYALVSPVFGGRGELFALPIFSALGIAITGAVLGMLQHLVLGNHIIDSRWQQWALANSAGLAPCGIIMGAAGLLLADSTLPELTAYFLIIALVALFGLIYGAITGRALTWLLREPEQSTAA